VLAVKGKRQLVGVERGNKRGEGEGCEEAVK
jgi:hypothetical protein